MDVTALSTTTIASPTCSKHIHCLSSNGKLWHVSTDELTQHQNEINGSHGGMRARSMVHGS